MSAAAVSAADDHTSHQAIPHFYRWLDKFEKHTIAPGVQKPVPPAGQSAQPGGEPALTAGMREMGTAESRREEPAVLVGSDSDPVGPGEGLGCYYHRSYYSHLPLFKNGSYHLPGSLAVAEPAQVLPQGTPPDPPHVPR